MERENKRRGFAAAALILGRETSGGCKHYRQLGQGGEGKCQGRLALPFTKGTEIVSGNSFLIPGWQKRAGRENLLSEWDTIP